MAVIQRYNREMRCVNAPVTEQEPASRLVRRYYLKAPLWWRPLCSFKIVSVGSEGFDWLLFHESGHSLNPSRWSLSGYNKQWCNHSIWPPLKTGFSELWQWLKFFIDVPLLTIGDLVNQLHNVESYIICTLNLGSVVASRTVFILFR